MMVAKKLYLGIGTNFYKRNNKNFITHKKKPNS